jgi:type IV pilus assembly protein PilX
MIQLQRFRPYLVQRGAALIVSLILLLIMTIIGIAAMNSARLEVSMAGAMQREETALRSAERALVAAERYTKDSTSVYDFADSSIAGHYPQGVELDVSGVDWAGVASLGPEEIGELSEHDTVVVQYLGLAEPSDVCGALNVGQSPPDGCRVSAYRITSRSEMNGKAVRIIESIFTKKLGTGVVSDSGATGTGGTGTGGNSVESSGTDVNE